jgi:hypothetical protein
MLPDIAALPAVVALAGAPVPAPPPSKLAVDPNIDDGEVPTVEHAAPLAVLGTEIVPVTPVGSGLRPGEVSSVEPRGMPVGPTDVPGLIPSGEVASSMGVVGIAPTCANALLQAKSAGSTTAINENLICIFLSKPASPLNVYNGRPLALAQLNTRLTLGLDPIVPGHSPQLHALKSGVSNRGGIERAMSDDDAEGVCCTLSEGPEPWCRAQIGSRFSRPTPPARAPALLRRGSWPLFAPSRMRVPRFAGFVHAIP